MKSNQRVVDRFLRVASISFFLVHLFPSTAASEAPTLLGAAPCPWGSSDCNTCVEDAVASLEALRTHGDILGFHMNGHPDVAGGMSHRHWQGVQRLAGDNSHYVVVSRSDDQKDPTKRRAFAIVRMESRQTDGHRFRSNRLSPTLFFEHTPPPETDGIVVAEPMEEGFNHAGGIQLLGHYLAVPYEGSGDLSRVVIYDLSQPESPRRLGNYIPGLSEHAGTASLTKLADGRFLLIIGRFDAERLDFYVSRTTDLATSLFDWFDTWERNGDFGAYQSLNLLTQCDGQLFLVGTEKNDSEEDFADLFRIENGVGEAAVLTKVASRHLFCRYRETRHCDFDAAAGIYVGPEGRLYLYATEHDNDGPIGSKTVCTNDQECSVKFEEFRPIPHGTCDDLQDAWVELYDDDTFRDRGLMIDFADRASEDYRNFDAAELFEDKASSVRWCIPVGHSHRLWEDKGPCGGRYLELEGSGTLDEIPDLEREAFRSMGDDVSCSEWITQSPCLRHTYLGNLPSEGEPGWHNEAQGVAHDDTHWYFSQNSGSDQAPARDPRLWRIPVSRDLSADVSCDDEGVACRRLSETDLLELLPDGRAAGYDHFGDISWRGGFLFVAITGPDPGGDTPPLIAAFRTHDASMEPLNPQLQYVDSVVLEQQKVSFWVGVDPDQGFLYSSDREVVETQCSVPNMPPVPCTRNIDRPFTKYAIDWERLVTMGELEITGGPWTVSILDEAGDPLEMVDMQGAAFSDDGRLLYLINGLDKPCDCGIHVFEARLSESDQPCGSAMGECVARRVAKSASGAGGFNYEYHPGASFGSASYEEPEGITYWDLDDGTLAKTGTTDLGVELGGQVHALMLDNDDFFDLDDVYLKHYEVDSSCEVGRGIDVAPRVLDFGDVGVGAAELDGLEISNPGTGRLTVQSLAFEATDSEDFSLASPDLPVSLDPGQKLTAELRFAPTRGGAASANLEVASDDGQEPLIRVLVAGTGVSLEDQASNLVGAFNEAVARGDLVGFGPGESADGRLGALRNMLEAAASLVETDRIDAACEQFLGAYERTDGRFPPPDFISGQAAPVLAREIQALRDRLGCVPVPLCGLGYELTLLLPLLIWLKTRCGERS